LAPAIELAPPDDPAAAAQAVHSARTFSWIVFTSANGVRVFFDMLDERREDARALGDAKVAAIGLQTSAALRSRGVYADLVPQTYIAEHLADALLAASKPGDRFLIYRAAQARDVLPEALRANGRDVVVAAAYKTVYTSDPDFAAKVARSGVLTFTSSSTVRGFVHNLGGEAEAARAAHGKIVACIGPVTAQEARAAGIPVDIVAHDYTAHGLVQALERLVSA
jgi:uroporphyrinogen III methyltransferase/synthase